MKFFKSLFPRSLGLFLAVSSLFVVALQAKAPVVASGATFTCTPVAVWDGDGPVWCAEGPRIRLAGIATREIDGGCRPSHPCPATSGVEARDYLVRLLGGSKGKLSTGHIKLQAPAMTCRSTGGAGGSRTAAWCTTAHGADLSCGMIAAGHAQRWARYWRKHRC